MKILIAFLVMILGICSVVAAPRTNSNTTSNDKASSSSNDSTGPGI